MDDKPNVRFIDAHAERDRRDDDLCLVPQKRVLVAVPVGLVHPGVIGQSTEAFMPQILGHVVDRVAAEAIDNAALVFMLVKIIYELLIRTSFWLDAVKNIRPV